MLCSCMCGDGLDVTIIFYEDLLFGAPFTGGNYVSTTTTTNVAQICGRMKFFRRE